MGIVKLNYERKTERPRFPLSDREGFWIVVVLTVLALLMFFLIWAYLLAAD